MADQRPPSGPGEGSGTTPDRATPPAAPRWIKVSAITVAALVLLVVVLKLTGAIGAGHGPGRHGPGRHGGISQSHRP